MTVVTDDSGDIAVLRRFARALCGSQAVGDAWVERAKLAQGPGTTGGNRGANARLKLFRSLIELWDRETSGTALVEQLILLDSSSSRAALPVIAPKARQAFLLMHFDKLSRLEVIEILDVTAEQFDALYAQAVSEINSQTSTRVLLIEDELFISAQIESVITDMGHWVTLARTKDEALSAVSEMRSFHLGPKLILSDIQLADGSSGLDAVRDISEIERVPVVFITAYPEAYLTGASKEPAFLLAKPFTENALKAMVALALFSIERQ